MNQLLFELESAVGVAGLRERILAGAVDVVAAVLILVFFFAAWQVLRRTMDAVIQRVGLDPTAASFLRTVVKTVLMSVGIVTALGRVGVNTASILTSLGVAGLTLGFAAKDALSNMISGIFIFWDRPFVIGDLVEIDGQYGRIENITMRSTRVVTPDGRMLAVPNTTVVNSTVASYTNFPHLRLDIPFTIGVHEQLARVRGVALSVCQGDPELLHEPPPKVVVTALNDYNVALELRVWLDDEHRHVDARNRLREALFEALRSANVDMPYETLAVVSGSLDA